MPTGRANEGMHADGSTEQLAAGDGRTDVPLGPEMDVYMLTLDGCRGYPIVLYVGPARRHGMKDEKLLNISIGTETVDILIDHTTPWEDIRSY